MKIGKKIVSVMLSLSMAITVFSGVSVSAADQKKEKVYTAVQAFAEESVKAAQEVNISAEALAATQEPAVTETPATVTPSPSSSPEVTASPQPTQTVMGIYDTDGVAVKVPVPYYYTKLNQLSNPQYNTYIIKAPLGYEENVIIPVKVKSKGALIYALAAQYDDVELSYYSLYSDAECTKFVTTSDKVAFVPKAGTYYIKISKTCLSKEGDSFIGAAFAFVSGANTTIQNKSKLVTCIMDYKTPYYYKVTVAKTTELTFSVTGEYFIKAALCNSKKTAITEETYISASETANKKLIYAVPKGTYYLRIKSSQGFIGTTATFKAMTSAAGTSKSQAGILKVNGKTKSILVLPAESTKRVYYMKFTNPKKQTINLNVISNFSSGRMQLEFIDSKGDSYGKKIICSGINEKQKFYVYQTSWNSSARTLPKGTYYIKFTKLDKKTSGEVQINIKNK